LRLVHLSDIHVWRYVFNPRHLLNKRIVGMAGLVIRRARKFRLERLHEVVEKVLAMDADHILITGDLTTTAFPLEFEAAREALEPLLADPGRVTILPGNHDRYTTAAVRRRYFEEWFGAYSPQPGYPWLRFLDEETAILGLDATRAHYSARGFLPRSQLAEARTLIPDTATRPNRLILANHYPLAAPPAYRKELDVKPLENAGEVSAWLAEIGPHVYCCGHVHAAWAFTPERIPNQLCLNAGAPLLRDRTGHKPPGFLVITLEGPSVFAVHHYWSGETWQSRSLVAASGFFPRLSGVG
jgi:3',5'-cyclic AMP phosphodiesterase CpdA